MRDRSGIAVIDGRRGRRSDRGDVREVLHSEVFGVESERTRGERRARGEVGREEPAAAGGDGAGGGAAAREGSGGDRAGTDRALRGDSRVPHREEGPESVQAVAGAESRLSADRSDLCEDGGGEESEAGRISEPGSAVEGAVL